jgi:hypothetical protein
MGSSRVSQTRGFGNDNLPGVQPEPATTSGTEKTCSTNNDDLSSKVMQRCSAFVKLSPSAKGAS